MTSPDPSIGEALTRIDDVVASLRVSGASASITSEVASAVRAMRVREGCNPHLNEPQTAEDLALVADWLGTISGEDESADQHSTAEEVLRLLRRIEDRF